MNFFKLIRTRLGEAFQVLGLQPAYYNSEEDKIYGANEGTLVWWHENGHRQQWKKDRERLKALNGQVGQFVMYSIILLAVDQKILAGALVIGGCFFPYLYYEVDAWIYAFKNYQWIEVGD